MKQFLSNILFKIISIFQAHFNKFNNRIYYWRLRKTYNINNFFIERPFNKLLNLKYFKIGAGTSFGKMVVLTAWDKHGVDEVYTPEVIIGKDCNFGDYLHLTCINKIEIGNNVLTGRWVTISDNGHGETTLNDMQIPPLKRVLSSKGPVKIGDNVWIGDKASILSGVTIGEGAIVGANSVVTKDIPPYCVAGGNPAKIIKRFI